LRKLFGPSAAEFFLPLFDDRHPYRLPPLMLECSMKYSCHFDPDEFPLSRFFCLPLRESVGRVFAIFGSFDVWQGFLEII